MLAYGVKRSPGACFLRSLKKNISLRPEKPLPRSTSKSPAVASTCRVSPMDISNLEVPIDCCVSCPIHLEYAQEAVYGREVTLSVGQRRRRAATLAAE